MHPFIHPLSTTCSYAGPMYFKCAFILYCDLFKIFLWCHFYSPQWSVSPSTSCQRLRGGKGGEGKKKKLTKPTK